MNCVGCTDWDENMDPERIQVVEAALVAGREGQDTEPSQMMLVDVAGRRQRGRKLVPSLQHDVHTIRLDYSWRSGTCR